MVHMSGVTQQVTWSHQLSIQVYNFAGNQILTTKRLSYCSRNEYHQPYCAEQLFDGDLFAF